MSSSEIDSPIARDHRRRRCARRAETDRGGAAASAIGYRELMRGDRVEVVVDTGQGVQRFDIVASRAGRRIEVTTARGVVEVTEVTRGGTPVRTGRFMASRLIALVEHPALESDGTGVEVTTRRRMGATDRTGRLAGRRAGHSAASPDQVAIDQLLDEETRTPDPVDELEAERRRREGTPTGGRHGT
jgi:hypothetical protein